MAVPVPTNRIEGKMKEVLLSVLRPGQEASSNNPTLTISDLERGEAEPVSSHMKSDLNIIIHARWLNVLLVSRVTAV